MGGVQSRIVVAFRSHDASSPHTTNDRGSSVCTIIFHNKLDCTVHAVKTQHLCIAIDNKMICIEWGESGDRGSRVVLNSCIELGDETKHTRDVRDARGVGGGSDRENVRDLLRRE